MRFVFAQRCAVFAFVVVTDLCAGQSTVNSGSITGTVSDPSGATIAGATVSIENPVSHYKNTVQTDGTGNFRLTSLPFSRYHLTAASQGFQPSIQDVDVRTTLPINLAIKLQLLVSESSVTVSAEAGDLVESIPTAHTDVDEKQFMQLPETSVASGDGSKPL